MSDRKEEHIDLALKSQTDKIPVDERFIYEPLIHKHPDKILAPFRFLGKKMTAPIWISSMTGGTPKAEAINHNLARACHEFGMGMGLGSCRSLLESNQFIEQFNLRKIIGDDSPFFANLGIAQVEKLVKEKQFDKISELIDKLEVDGLIIHVNPLQEWIQPEGDKLDFAPVETIQRVLDKLDVKIIVKEVGQGFGPESLERLLSLPLAAIDFGAYGGTNFAIVELLRGDEPKMDALKPLASIGHTAVQMVETANRIKAMGINILCDELIISGGIKSFLDGFYLMKKSKFKTVYGQGSAMLKQAKMGYEPLKDFISHQITGLQIAESYLKIREINK